MKLQAEAFIRLPPYVDFRAPADINGLLASYLRLGMVPAEAQLVIEHIELTGDRVVRHIQENQHV